jgi:hypothetical protein
MFQFEIHLARYMLEMQKERDAKAEKKAEQERLNQSKIADDFLRNSGETKSQLTNFGKRGSR